MTTDLVVLVADKDIEQVVLGLLERHKAIGIREVKAKVLRHPNHDPGCFNTGHLLLEPFSKSHLRALVVFDSMGSGTPSENPLDMAQQVERRLRECWGERARCIVISPEVENWVWSDSPHVATELGWKDRSPDLRSWLAKNALWPEGSSKPPEPKQAMRRALRECSDAAIVSHLRAACPKGQPATLRGPFFPLADYRLAVLVPELTIGWIHASKSIICSSEK